jgi:tetratricopeptide (TPR) repeat protein
MKKSFLLIFLLVFGMNAHASFSGALKIFQSGDKNRYPQLVSELIQEKMYFSSIPFLKEYLSTTNRVNDAAVDKIVDQLISEVGVKQFEVLPLNILEKSNAPAVRYILARKAFRQGKYDQALKFLDKSIEDWNPVKPFALLLEGSIYAVSKREEKATAAFKECVSVAEMHIKKEKDHDKDRLRQLQISRDYCIVGIPRAQFSMGKYNDANSGYLDLDKSSYIWPEILFEEAWNSFYLKDYNRTLGKLVTYKAPVFNYIFNPEIEVLKALSFMELCLWDDSKNTVEAFYTKYEKDNETYKKFIDSLGKDYKQYYLLVKEHSEGKKTSNGILNTALTSISKDPAYLELYSSFNAGRDEIERMKLVSNDKLRAALNENLKESLNMQRNLIGSYIRGQLQLFAAQIVRAFEDMSYIKLEVLSKLKTELYENISIRSEDSRTRGNIAHLKRTDKQYFWTFNGEFWADELGDYVFSLKSECK